MNPATPHTSEYHGAFEVEQARSLRRRFMQYCVVVIALILAWRLGAALMTYGLSGMGGAVASAGANADQVVRWSAAFIRAALYGWALWVSARRAIKREDLLRLAFGLILASGFVALAANVAQLMVASDGAPLIRGTSAVTLGISGAIAVLIVHLLACVFLPFRPSEAVRVAVPLVAANVLITAAFGFRTPLVTVLTILLIATVAFPGIAVCWWRFSRFREQYAVRQIRGRYSELRRELVDARRLHEALFPPQVTDGPLRLGYVYEPMRQIGGDYLFARFEPDARRPKRFHLLIIDVTGHGIAAALTVNRLYGEIERLFAENPETGPGEVLAALNRYVHLTLSRHSIYATALCVRIDTERDLLEYASGGHPPAYVATADGRIERLDSTSFVLGACPPSEFDPGVRTCDFMEGDTLIAYTDGAMEARNREGRMFGLAGLEQALATCTIRGGHVHGFCRSVLEAVDSHRAGQADDDTLIVEVRRAVHVRPQTLPVSALEATVARAR
ncbi:MAG: serine/threonine-protein phosphatase [Phycisphaeraceae bacterium]|nr:serine/threonine-protein phosphatase [Phycisphaeraceae bacterium]